MKITAQASPNHNARPKGMAIDTIVLHADAADNAKASISWIASPQSKVSYHVLIDRDGSVYRFVETARRAWHAGVSLFDGRSNVNDFSIGLAFANKNDGVEPYTDLQYEVGAAVAAGWIRVYPAITLERITTHAAVREAWRKHYPDAEVKTDPKGFDLSRFRHYVQQTLEGVKVA